MKKNISTSIYTFEDLIKGCSLYIDKTRYFYDLAVKTKGQYFCARPRRFGKSLAISTFEAIFTGKKDLFKGLYIYDQDYDWEAYPVIHIDFGRGDLTTIDSLNEWLNKCLSKSASEHSVSASGSTIPILFGDLIEQLYKKSGRGVVILVDEYDKPILDHMDTAEDAEAFRSYLDSFYQIIKGSDPFLRFVFITGVTKFAKVSIFSKLNNLDDLTMSEDYACMFGFTQEELEENFAEYLDETVTRGARNRDGKLLDRQGLLAEIRTWYDGFCFSENADRVYNPVSVGKFFNNRGKFNNYWFETGTPSFLIRLMQKNFLSLVDVSEAVLSEYTFNTFNVAELAGDRVPEDRIIQMLYQTGYLTIDHRLELPGILYRMRFPNHEVELSFEQNLLDVYAGPGGSSPYITALQLGALKGDADSMIQALQGLLAALPYDIQIKHEKYYQSILYMAFLTSGMEMQTEVSTNIGRIDAVLKAGKHLYIIECKLNKSPGQAIGQIDDKKYAEKYILPARAEGWQIHKLGINFVYGEGKRNIEDYAVEDI